MILILLVDFLFSFSKLQTQIYILRIEVCGLLIKLLYKLYSFNYKPRRELEVILYINLYIINTPLGFRPLKGFYSAFVFKSISGYFLLKHHNHLISISLLHKLKFSLLSSEIRIYTSYLLLITSLYFKKLFTMTLLYLGLGFLRVYTKETLPVSEVILIKKISLKYV